MDDSVNELIRVRLARVGRLVTIALIILTVLQVGLFLVLFAFVGAQAAADWLPELVLAILFTLLLGAIALYAVGQAQAAVQRDVSRAVGQELRELHSANDRAQSLQRMASTLSATLSFERVVEQSLDVCSLALEEMGIPRQSLVGAVFLYERGMLRPIARRRFLGNDSNQVIAGKEGVVGAALSQAAVSYTHLDVYKRQVDALGANLGIHSVQAATLQCSGRIPSQATVGTECHPLLFEIPTTKLELGRQMQAERTQRRGDLANLGT